MAPRKAHDEMRIIVAAMTRKCYFAAKNCCWSHECESHHVIVFSGVSALPNAVRAPS